MLEWVQEENMTSLDLALNQVLYNIYTSHYNIFINK